MSKAALSAFSEERAKLTGTRMRFHSGYVTSFCEFSVTVINPIIDTSNNETRKS